MGNHHDFLLEEIGRIIMIEYKKWDSDILGLKIGEITDVDDSIIEEISNYDYIYAKIPTQNVYDIGFLEKMGFRYVEAALGFVCPLYHTDPEKYSTGNYKISIATAEDLDEILELSNRLFTEDRFTKEFGKDASNKIYGEWIKNCINKTYGDACFVARDNESIRGFVTCRLDRFIGHLDLIAKIQTNDNLADLLVEKVKNFCRERAHIILRTATQASNKKSVHLWERNGFTTDTFTIMLARRNK